MMSIQIHPMFVCEGLLVKKKNPKEKQVPNMLMVDSFQLNINILL